MLILLGIANGFTAGVRQRMMKCEALLGSYDEAVQMLVEFVCERSVEARQRRVTNALNLRGVNRDCS